MTIQRIFRRNRPVAAAIALLLHAALMAAPKPAAQPAHPGPKGPDIATLVAFLQPDSPVLTVGDMTITWQEFAPIMGKLTTSRTKQQPTPEQIRAGLRKLLQSCASRGLLLQEARAMKLTVTPEDRLKYEADLEKSLQGNDKGMTKEKFIASFSQGASTMLSLNYEDALLLMKLDQVKFASLEVPKETLDSARKYLGTINQAMQKQNDARKATCQEIIDNPKSKTDKGFSDLVREYSEGIEAKWGGELRYDFTREELAAVCYLDKFEFKVGENTPVCETNSAFRILRVLREVPQQDGQAPKLRVAQVLIGKIPTQDTSEPAVRARLLKELRKLSIAQFTQELTAKYSVKTLFFPDGLWTKPGAPQPASKGQAQPKPAN